MASRAALKLKKLLTSARFGAIITHNLILQTVEAEITAMMPLQRAWDAESQVRNKLSNGPLRAQSNVVFTLLSVLTMAFSQSILRRCRQTSFAGDMLVSC